MPIQQLEATQTGDGQRGGRQSSGHSRSVNMSMVSSMAVAIVIHFIIALSIGGYVVYEGIVPNPFFESDFSDGGTPDIMEEMPTLLEEEPLPMVQTEQTQVVEEEGGADSPDMSDLITVSNASIAPTFSMPTVAGSPGLIRGSFTGGSGSGEGTGIGKGKVKLGSYFGGKNMGSRVMTGYLYDFKQDSNRNVQSYNKGIYGNLSRVFTDSWRISEIKQFYRSAEPLQLTQVMIPMMGADAAPAAFGVADEVQPRGWMAHYEGNITPPETGKFRLWGKADDVLIVRINEEIVLDASLTDGYSNADMSKVRTGEGGLYSGKWMELREGESYPIELVIGEVPGGGFNAYLLVEQEGQNYDRHPNGYPILPVFQMIPTELPEKSELKVDGALVFGAPSR